jgi:hypothetical protein
MIASRLPANLFVLSAFLLGVCHAATETNLAGLVEVRTRYLEKVHLRPQADFAAYRKVLIEPTPVNLQTRANINERYPRRIPPEQAKEISDLAGAAVHRALVQAFKERGYEISAAPGPGVLRLSPRVAELVINAPSGGPATHTFTREAGDATLLLEARDAVTGNLLASVRHSATAKQMGQLQLANQTTNAFWFESFFSRWAADCAEVLKSPPQQ